MTYSDRAILVGDSAGMVNPITGGGIAFAMQAGKIGAFVLRRALDEARSNSKVLQQYHLGWIRAFGHQFSSLLLAQRIFLSPFIATLFEIGLRDWKIQTMVANVMSETSREGIGTLEIVSRALFVAAREAFHL
jgi:flavin-dependent dehydrogenase